MRNLFRQAAVLTITSLCLGSTYADQIADRLNSELEFVVSDKAQIKRNVDLITDIKSDSISTGQAALLRGSAAKKPANEVEPTDSELSDFDLNSLESQENSTGSEVFQPARKRAR